LFELQPHGIQNKASVAAWTCSKFSKFHFRLLLLQDLIKHTSYLKYASFSAAQFFLPSPVTVCQK